LIKLVAFLLLVACGCAQIVRADDYISVTPGPDFTSRVNTPWGNYVVDLNSDGTAAWVGTEDEYINRKAQSVFKREGFSEMHVDGAAPNEHYMVSNQLPKVQLGRITLAQVQASIIFHKQHFAPIYHAPAERGGTRYVAINWQPSGKINAQLLLLDPSRKETYRPFACDNVENNFCLWQLPEPELGVPLTIIFAAPNAAPAATPIRSLAYLSYAGERQLGILDAETSKHLHQLDSSIP
jgi:hypothetical protein